MQRLRLSSKIPERQPRNVDILCSARWAWHQAGMLISVISREMLDSRGFSSFFDLLKLESLKAVAAASQELCPKPDDHDRSSNVK
jgi:hypothetical protein